MGLASWVMDIGIRVETATQQLGVRRGVVPLQWPAGQPGSVVYRLPRDPHQRASIFATAQTIVVNEGEVALVLEDGRSAGALPPGRYSFEKARVVGSLDIVWMKSGQQALKWGIGNVSSSDGIQINANGVLYVRIADGSIFNSEVVQGAITVAELDLQRFLMPRVQGVLRSAIGGWGALDLQTQREAFVANVKGGLASTFERMGLGIVDFEVIEVNFPPEFKAVIAQAAMSQHGGRAALIEANTRVQILQMEAAGAAQARLSAGVAEVQVMALLQAQGIDPLKLKAIEAMQVYAATPSMGGGLMGSGLMGGDAGKAGLLGQLAMAALAQGMPVPQPPSLQAPLQATPIISADAAPAENAGDLERQLDALVERLAEGKISEELYMKLSARLEARLSRLRSP